ncbi:hypothetical protein G5I_00693 [Acromyrmex echinatior]|uniref:Uncharacterized protein n=1 Tax=Acromyrmex echinatior TaxID=103372 RepID=F4W5J6_ACREC|nr:hypothetical protein G5I_00693 [Acromyrmex echinatior]
MAADVAFMHESGASQSFGHLRKRAAREEDRPSGAKPPPSPILFQGDNLLVNQNDAWRSSNVAFHGSFISAPFPPTDGECVSIGIGYRTTNASFANDNHPRRSLRSRSDLSRAATNYYPSLNPGSPSVNAAPSRAKPSRAKPTSIYIPNLKETLLGQDSIDTPNRHSVKESHFFSWTRGYNGSLVENAGKRTRYLRVAFSFLKKNPIFPISNVIKWYEKERGDSTYFCVDSDSRPCCASYADATSLFARLRCVSASAWDPINFVRDFDKEVPRLLLQDLFIFINITCFVYGYWIAHCCTFITPVGCPTYPGLALTVGQERSEITGLCGISRIANDNYRMLLSGSKLLSTTRVVRHRTNGKFLTHKETEKKKRKIHEKYELVKKKRIKLTHRDIETSAGCTKRTHIILGSFLLLRND